MTRKDYKAIAEAVRRNSPRPGEVTDADMTEGAQHRWVALAEDLAQIMLRDNPRFDRVRFLEACGL